MRAASPGFTWWMAQSLKAAALVDTRVISCGDNLEQLRYRKSDKLPRRLVNRRFGQSPKSLNQSEQGTRLMKAGFFGAL